MEHKTYIEEKCEEFMEKTGIYDKDGGFIVYVEDFENNDLDTDLQERFLSNALHDLLNKINDWAEREKKEDLSKYPECDWNTALAELQTHLASLGK